MGFWEHSLYRHYSEVCISNTGATGEGCVNRSFSINDEGGLFTAQDLGLNDVSKKNGHSDARTEPHI